MHQSVSAYIILLWSDSLLLRPEVSYLCLRNFAAVHHLTLLVNLITKPSHMLEVWLIAVHVSFCVKTSTIEKQDCQVREWVRIRVWYNTVSQLLLTILVMLKEKADDFLCFKVEDVKYLLTFKLSISVRDFWAYHIWKQSFQV